MKKSVNMRLDTELLEDAKKIAKKTKRSLTQLVTDILLELISQHKER